MSHDPFRLQRFIEAQASCYNQVVRELQQGLKTSHWMWFIFPQLDGLGFSAMAKQYAISGLAETEAYLQHDELGVRLETCTRLVNQHSGKTAQQIFGAIDALKFRSSMTLFNCVRSGDIFQQAIEQFYDGKPDSKTLCLLGYD